jgi:UDP-N-acetylglucosamine 2-epimerase (non-hydrolysing)
VRALRRDALPSARPPPRDHAQHDRADTHAGVLAADGVDARTVVGGVGSQRRSARAERLCRGHLGCPHNMGGIVSPPLFMTASPIAIVLGTRPEIIKTAPVIWALKGRKVPFVLLHTGQHYTESLDAALFEDLGLDAPDVRLEVGSLAAPLQIAAILERTAGALSSLRPSWVLVQGDTNTVLGAALAALKLAIPVAHLEAGLRSDDWDMPEEGNRVLVGRLASLHLCPTEVQRRRLASEGITEGVHVVGNTIVDAVIATAQRSLDRSRLHERIDLGGRYAVLTLHRPSNVDDRKGLEHIVAAVEHAADAHRLRVYWPAHPRTLRWVDELRSRSSPVRILDALGYLDFLRLLRGASVVLTDSGGLQEEACTLRVPCITLRSTTERPEAAEVGANVLCPPSASAHPTSFASRLEPLVAAALTSDKSWRNPFGDGKSAERTVELLTSPHTRRAPSGHRAP